MKKILVLALTALTITGLVGCGAKDSKAEGNKNNSQLEQQDSNTENNKQNDEKNDEEEILLAKVISIIGNEISVNLSNEKYELNDYQIESKNPKPIELDSSQQKIVDNGGMVKLDDNTIVGGTSGAGEYDPDEDPGMSMEEIEEYRIENGIDDESIENPLKDFSFDAGSKEFIIPAGAGIFNFTTNIEGKLSEIKEGSVLNIIIDKKTNTVIGIDILK